MCTHRSSLVANLAENDTVGGYPSSKDMSNDNFTTLACFKVDVKNSRLRWAVAPCTVTSRRWHNLPRYEKDRTHG